MAGFVSMQQPQSIYYLTGMGGQLATGLGEELTRRGLDVSGRELSGEFRQLGFQERIDIVAGDLQTHHWRERSRVVANSFGAYIFLHAQAQMTPYVGKVLLLSPIVGEFGNEQITKGFIPPRSARLHQLARSGQYPKPTRCEIHVGSDDWQSNPSAVLELGDLLGLKVTVAQGAGHNLPKAYVREVLDVWLSN
jgi:hypothetical protein